jgi:hypothetical protein
VTPDLYRVDAPHFCAGLEADNGKVIRAAPIIGWMVGRRLDHIADYCRKKRWTVAGPIGHKAGDATLF